MGYIKRKTEHGERIVKIDNGELEQMVQAGTAVLIKGSGGKIFAEVEGTSAPKPKKRPAEPPEKAAGEYETTQMKPKAQK